MTRLIRVTTATVVLAFTGLWGGSVMRTSFTPTVAYANTCDKSCDDVDGEKQCRSTTWNTKCDSSPSCSQTILCTS